MKHKKLIFLLLTVFFIYTIYIFYHGKYVSYIALGDSFALGENPYGQVGYGYSDYFKDYLGEKKKVKFYTKNFAVSNYRISDVKRDILLNKRILLEDKIFSLKNALREANYITLTVGANDILEEYTFDEDLVIDEDKVVNKIGNDLNDLIKIIKKYNKNIILVGYYNLFMYKNDSHIFEKLNRKYKNIAVNNNIKYIDIYNKINKTFLPNPLNVHPNVFGYRRIYIEIKNNE